jgi:predicted RecA/RadA family phage recombinase
MTHATRIKSGSIIPYTPGADVPAKSIVLQGDLFGVATSDIAANKLGSLDCSGVYEIPKAGATVFAAGALVYWDNTNKLAVTTDGSGTHKLLGKSVLASGNGPTVVRVLLTP